MLCRIFLEKKGKHSPNLQFSFHVKFLLLVTTKIQECGASNKSSNYKAVSINLEKR